MDFVNICGQSFCPTPVSGGDVLNFELMKRFGSRTGVYLIINEVTVLYMQKHLKCQVLAIKDFLDLNKLVQKQVVFAPLAFLSNIIRVNEVLRKSFTRPLVLYSAGDFICNIVPAVLHKIRYPRSRLVVRIFHINESPAKRKGNPFVSSAVSFLFQRLSFFLIKKYADLIFLLNQDVEDSLFNLGFNPAKMHVLGAGLDLAKIRGVDGQVIRDNIVFFLGRFSPTKGVFDLPKIWPLVLEDIPEARLVLIGSAPPATLKELKAAFNESGVLDTVEFKGFIEDIREVYRLLKTGKVFISPSYEEGWGITVFEAIACGLCPVVYGLSIFRELFGKDIKTIPLGNTVAFAQAIVDFLTHEGLRMEKVTRLRRTVERYDWERVFRGEMELMGVANRE